MRHFLALVVCLWAVTGLAAESVPADSGLPYAADETLQVPMNKSRILDIAAPARKISVGNKTIADIVVLKTRQVQIFGLTLGSTNIMFWDKGGQLIKAVNLEVTPDLEALKEKFYRLLPGEGVQVHAAQGNIILGGEVSSLEKMDAALSLAKSFSAKEGTVLNFMQVGGIQQVMLEVQVAEISRSLMKRIGMKFNAISPDNGSWTIGGVHGGATFPEAILKNVPRFNPLTGEFIDFDNGVAVPIFGGDTIYGPTIREFVPNPVGIANTGLFASFLSGDLLFNVVLDAAKDTGLAKVLAEPTLTTLTGQEASFLAGGEFPIPVPSGDNKVTIDYKEYGVGLKFLPVVLDSGKINLKVNISVSEIASANSVSLNVANTASTYFVPALTKRSANTTVSLASGQTIGIAGLINENLRENMSKLPLLGDLPVLGLLFRSQEYVKGQTELVIFVTPHFARPMQPEQVRLPTDSFVEPNDTEFYLLGRMENQPAPPPQDPLLYSNGLEGPIGHGIVPEAQKGQGEQP